MVSGVLWIVAVALLVTPAAAQDDRALAEVVLRLQTLEDELRDLRGELEAQRFRQRELEADVERLLGAPAPGTPAAPGTRDDPALGGSGTLGGTPPSPATAIDQPAVANVPQAPTTDGVAPPSGAASFAEGMALLQTGRYAEARSALDRFVTDNPDDRQAPEAAFWSAETLFFEGRYEAAAAAFAANYRAFGSAAPRAPDSLLKVAMALNQMGDPERACLTLDELQRRHGTSLGRSLEAAVTNERGRADCG